MKLFESYFFEDTGLSCRFILCIFSKMVDTMKKLMKKLTLSIMETISFLRLKCNIVHNCISFSYTLCNIQSPYFHSYTMHPHIMNLHRKYSDITYSLLVQAIAVEAV